MMTRCGRWLSAAFTGLALLTLSACGSDDNGGGFTAPPGSNGSVYVANGSNDSITVYPLGSSGDQPPVRVISGSATGLSEPAGVAVDQNGKIYVANSGNGTVTTYAPGADGNQAPLDPPITGFNLPSGIAVDTNGTIYVTDGGTVWILALGGPTTSFTVPGVPAVPNAPSLVGIAIDFDGNLVVGDASNNLVYRYTVGGSLVSYLGGSLTGLNIPLGIAVTSANELIVANTGTNPGGEDDSVTVYPANAQPDTAPAATLAGNITGFADIGGIALDGNDSLYVANASSNGIEIFPAGSNGNVAPSSTIQGAHTGLNFPAGVAIGR